MLIFDCLTMKALHLEIADNLIKELFMLDLSQFITKERHVKTITYNRSNFIGGESEFRLLVN